MSVFTWRAVIFGVGCGLLTFLPDKWVFVWILSSIPFYIFLFCCYLNYMMFYERVETVMESEIFPEEEIPDGADHTGRQRQEAPAYHADISEKSGFQFPSRFIRLFKENAGCTPSLDLYCGNQQAGYS